MFTRWLSNRIGELEDVVVDRFKFKGIYVSVWFNEYVENARSNRSIEGAPPYYIEFIIGKEISPLMVRRVIDEWIDERGLREKLAKWSATYHVKYFYNARVITRKGVGWMEIWWEANYNGVKDEIEVVGGRPRLGKMVVISGLPLYRWLPFRVVGVRAVHPIGRHIIVLRSDFVHQYRVWEVMEDE